MLTQSVVSVRSVALLALFAVGAISARANPTWTVSYDSPSPLAKGKIYSSELNPPTNGRQLLGAPSVLALTDVIDALSFGDDPVCCGNEEISFSVTRRTFGVPGTAVDTESRGDGPGADVFVALPLVGPGNARVHNAPDLGLSARVGVDPMSEDEVVSLELDLPTTAGLRYPFYFSLAPGSPSLALNGWSAADILIAINDVTINVYVTAEELSLPPSADIDALALRVEGGPMAVGPVLFSLSSASVVSFPGLSGADVLTRGPQTGVTSFAFPYIAYSHLQLGLQAGDEVDAVDVSLASCGAGPKTASFDDRPGDHMRYASGAADLPDIASIDIGYTGLHTIVTTNFVSPISVGVRNDNEARLTAYFDLPDASTTGVLTQVDQNSSEYSIIDSLLVNALTVVDHAYPISDVVSLTGGPTRRVHVASTSMSIALDFRLDEWTGFSEIDLFLQVNNRDSRVTDFAPDCGYITIQLPPPVFPEISLSESTFSPSVDYGGSAASDSFEVWNSGGDTLNYRISDDADWLSVSPATGASTGERDTIVVNYSTSGLPFGPHSAQITIRDADALNTPQTINVDLQVVPPPAKICTRALWQGSLAVIEGDVLPSEQIEVWNCGGDPFNYTVSSLQPWIVPRQTSGSVAMETDVIDIDFDTSGVLAGYYEGLIEVASSQTTRTTETVAVALLVVSSGAFPADVVLTNVVGQPTTAGGTLSVDVAVENGTRIPSAYSFTLGYNVDYLTLTTAVDVELGAAPQLGAIENGGTSATRILSAFSVFPSNTEPSLTLCRLTFEAAKPLREAAYISLAPGSWSSSLVDRSMGQIPHFYAPPVEVWNSAHRALVLDFILGSRVLSEAEKTMADVNSDGVIDIADVAHLDANP